MTEDYYVIDSAMYTNPGGRDNNEDYVVIASHECGTCYILCDGLGGHECGEVASMTVAEYVASQFREHGDSFLFLSTVFNGAQDRLLKLQKEKAMEGEMKTTLVVLIVTDSYIKWAHIGDSRLYHIYNAGTQYERTKDHSLVQLMVDMGEIGETEMRKHEDRNKLLRVMGAKWNERSFDESAILEREAEKGFALMSDGFWEYIDEEEMLKLYRETDTAEEWLNSMKALVEERADMNKTDNYSAICVKVPAV